jgi:hypothetical protein
MRQWGLYYVAVVRRTAPGRRLLDAGAPFLPELTSNSRRRFHLGLGSTPHLDENPTP